MTAAVEFARLGIRIERVLTDNGTAYTRQFDAAVEALGAHHKSTRLYPPQTNGKAERFTRTLVAESAYGRSYRTNLEPSTVLPAFVDFYNRRRPHAASAADHPSMLSTTSLGATASPGTSPLGRIVGHTGRHRAPTARSPGGA